ncbi:MAG: hypothetical protein FJZ89_00480 [Chloroflexi bacterium]|nr:hypothetical protein [Chloroflexota bacterium]
MNRDFLRRLWALDNAERPAFQFNVQADTGTTLLERFHDVPKMLRHQLAEFALRPDLEDDFVPAFFPYLGTAIFPSAFGCPVRWFDDQDPWARPIVDRPQAVYALPEPAVTDGDLGRVLDYTRRMAQAHVGWDAEARRFTLLQDRLVPRSSSLVTSIRMTDVQGPLDVASLIWGEEDFLVALYEHPAEVHHLMGKATRLIIDFVQEQRRIVRQAGREFIPCHYPPIWMPEDAGLALSDDLLALLSPRLYAEFGLPYVNQLAEAFGGVFIHSCGNFRHNLGNLAQVHNLRGVDFAASETPFAAVAEALGGRAVLSVRLGLNKDIHFPSIPAFVEHVLQTRRTNRGLLLVINLWYSLPGSGQPLQPGDVPRMARQIAGVQGK